MKKFKFDKKGNLSVTEIIVVDVEENGETKQVEQSEQRDINADQLAVHLPMLIVDMPPETLLKAQEIIKGLSGV